MPETDTTDPRVFVYQCCFCREGIEQTDIDPCSVVVTFDWKHETKEHDSPWQQWWAHFGCFQKVTDNAVDDDHLEDIRHDIKEWADGLAPPAAGTDQPGS